MTSFVLLYTGGGMPESDTQREAVMAEWGAWYDTLGAAIKDGGNPFGAAKHLSAKGVSDGAASSPPATGYTIISADSLDAAVALTENHPQLRNGGQVSVYETFEM